jgi:15-cis-phytoene synthase
MALQQGQYRSYPSAAWQTIAGMAGNTRTVAKLTLSTARAFTDDWTATPSDSDVLMSAHARTFRFATRFMPAAYRRSTMDLYAFFRTLDDLVDEHESDSFSIAPIERELDQWEEWFESGLTGEAPRAEIGAALRPLIERHDIPGSLFIDFLSGMRADLSPRTPRTRSEVEQYSYQVASTVGISMAHLFGATHPAAIASATRLGIAMQLTNILRDIGGDLERGRVYLPAELLHRHSIDEETLLQMWQRGEGPDERLRSVVREMIDWADEHYASGIRGIALLPRDVRFPILVAARLYQAILRQLEENELDSLRKRVFTTRWQKMSEAYRCSLILSRTQTRSMQQSDPASAISDGEPSRNAD